MTPWCEAYVPMPPEVGGGLAPCKAPAVASYRFSCAAPAAHQLTRSVCADHDPIPGEVGCRFCHDEGKEVPMTWEVIALAGPAPGPGAVGA